MNASRWREEKNRRSTYFFLVSIAKKRPNNDLMRVLIQSTVTFLYLMDHDTGTQNPEEARDFKQASRALRFIKDKRMNNVQIVLKFPKSSDDVNLAILELLEREQKKPFQFPRAVSNETKSRSLSA